MTLQQLAAVIVSADPNARHYDATAAAAASRDFTVWMEFERTGLDADDGYAEKGWRFEVSRFTKVEYDPVAEAIEETLSSADGITFTYRVEYDVESKYIRHIFEGEAI